jgi:Spy/CpxP family protein refolding chaperone
MMKRLFSITAAVLLFSAVAMAQEAPTDGPAAGPDTAIAQAGPMQESGVMRMRSTGGPMQGPGPRFLEMRVRGPMGHGLMRWGHMRGMGSWWMNPEVAERIGLSEQQKQQLEKIALDGRLKMIDLRADLEKQQVMLTPMMKGYHPDEAQVLAQVEKVSMARAELEKARVQTMLACRNVLTEDQWNKLKETPMGFHRSFGQRGFRRPMGRRLPSSPPSK